MRWQPSRAKLTQRIAQRGDDARNVFFREAGVKWQPQQALCEHVRDGKVGPAVGADRQGAGEWRVSGQRRQIPAPRLATALGQKPCNAVSRNRQLRAERRRGIR